MIKILHEEPSIVHDTITNEVEYKRPDGSIISFQYLSETEAWGKIEAGEFLQGYYIPKLSLVGMHEAQVYGPSIISIRFSRCFFGNINFTPFTDEHGYYDYPIDDLDSMPELSQAGYDDNTSYILDFWISQTDILEYLKLEKVEFLGEFRAENLSIKGTMDFTDVVFNDSFKCKNLIGHDYFRVQECLFKSDVTFFKSEFHKPFGFTSTKQVEGWKLRNVVLGNANFSHSKFRDDSILDFTYFNSLQIAYCKFYEDCQMVGVEASHVNLEDTHYYTSLMLSPPQETKFSKKEFDITDSLIISDPNNKRRITNLFPLFGINQFNFNNIVIDGILYLPFSVLLSRPYFSNDKLANKNKCSNFRLADHSKARNKAEKRNERKEYYANSANKYSWLKEQYERKGAIEDRNKAHYMEMECRHKSLKWQDLYQFKSTLLREIGYGVRLRNTMFWICATIFMFAAIYMCNPCSFSELPFICNKIFNHEIINGLAGFLYFSSVTFLTIGYGDITPLNLMSIVVIIEGFAGVLLTSILVVIIFKKFQK